MTSDIGAIGDKIKALPTNMTLGEFGKRHGKTPNRDEPINPLGLESVIKNVYDELVNILGSQAKENQLQELTQKCSGSADDLLLDIHSVLGKLVECMIISQNADSYFRAECQDDETLIRLVKYNENLQAFFDSCAVIDTANGCDDVESQLFQLKAFFNSFNITCMKIASNHIGTDPTRKFVEQIAKYTVTLVADLNRIIYSYKEISPFVKENIRNLDPRKGPYQKSGEFQKIEAADWYQYQTSPKSAQNANPYLRNYRKTYQAKRQTSYPKLATDFGNKGPSERDNVESAYDNFKTNFTAAATAPGAGDKIQQDKGVESTPMTQSQSGSSSGGSSSGGSSSSECRGTCGPMDENAFENYKKILGQRESSNKYDCVNSIGYCGKWQFGAPALIDFGYVRAGTSTRSLAIKEVWTGKDGIQSREDFLANKDNVQDKLILAYTRRHYKILSNMGVVGASDETGKVCGYLMAAHLKGPGGAKKLASGTDNADGYGTKASDYFKMGQAVNGNPSNEATKAVASAGGDVKAQRAAFVGSTTLSDGAPVVMPPSDTATVRYPYNNPKVSEAGHFKEYDDTPGNERIQERHRLGTGYEVDSNGRLKTMVVSDRYSAVMGNDYILVQGHCQIIAMGDVGIKAGGDVNINAGKDINLVAGNNINTNVGGDARESISGTKNTIVQGDRADQTGGYHKIGADGDASFEAASMSLIARDSQVNIAAKTDANIQAVGNAQLLGKAKTMITSGGNTIVSSGGTVGIGGQDISMGAKGSFGVNSGSDITLQAKGGLGLSGNGPVNATVLKANWSDQSGKAGQANPAVTTVTQPQSTPASHSYAAQDEQDKRQEAIKQKSFDKKVAEFNPISGTSQGHGGGQPGSGWDGSGYKKGIVDV